MKSIIALVTMVVIATAEPPPSNSYLPPPPGNRGFSTPQLPQVIAARTLDQRNQGPHSAAANPLARNAQHPGSRGQFHSHGQSGPQSRINDDHKSHDHHDQQGLERNAQGYEKNTHLDKNQGYERNGQGYERNGQGYERNGQGYERNGQGYERNAPGYDKNAALARNALEEVNAEPANYNFGYMVNDYQEGTDFGHHEERQEERAQGEYHVVLPDGRKQTVSYEADERGFKPQISYEDTEDLTRSGYDDNANNFRANSHHGNGQNGGHGGHDSPHSNGY